MTGGFDKADTLIRRYLPLGLGLLCALQFAAWAPHYVTWPWWTDHDVFATAARAWDAGVIPYRDFRLNNFPGTIYVFWVLGRLFGWGATIPLYAFDAFLLALLGGLLCVWSLKQFGHALAGAVSYALFLSYYLGLNYSLVAQRDWHAAFLGAAALIILQTWHTRPAWIAAGALFAIGLSIRPQVILFTPAVAAVMAFRIRDFGDRSLEPAVTLFVTSATVLLLLSYPLVRAGAFASFVASATSLVQSGGYGDMSTAAMMRRFAFSVAPVRMIAVPAALGLVWASLDTSSRRTAIAWSIAYAGALAYSSLGPRDNPYLNHPVMLMWSMLAGILAAAVVNEKPAGAPSLSLAVVLLVLASGVTLRPAFTDRGRALAAVRLGRAANASRPPAGYTSGGVLSSSSSYTARYDWRDYRAVLEYLASLPPDVKVANALYGAPALTGPSGRLSAFPAESIAWLLIVRRADEPVFADALQRAVDSVVVWSPSEIRRSGNPPLPQIFSTVHEYYEPDRQFGEIEVWRRRTRRPGDSW
jgi:hypothetical protein